MLQLCRSKYEWIDKFTIYGERHSGTNFLEECIKKQFGLNITYFYGFKHWLGFAKPERIAYDRHILYLGIVRNPYDWLTAFFNAPHHVPIHSRLSLESFLTNEWYSIDHNDKEIMGDRNYTTQPNLQRYKNIFELRKQKCIYLSQDMPVLASNYVLLSYDSFLKNHKTYLNIIGRRFDLKDVGSPPDLIEKRSIEMEPHIKNLIDTNLDWSVEESLGYYKT
jgi:hypothetical protein